MHCHNLNIVRHYLCVPFLLCAMLFILSSCNHGTPSFGCGNVNSNGQADGPWTIYWHRFTDSDPYRIKAKGNLLNGRLDGVWTMWGDTYGFVLGEKKAFQGTFKDGVPNGEFMTVTSGRSAAIHNGRPIGDITYNTFQDINGNISGTIEGYAYSGNFSEFNIPFYVKYVVQNNQIVSVLEGRKDVAEKNFENLKLGVDSYIHEIHKGLEEAKPENAPLGLSGC